MANANAPRRPVAPIPDAMMFRAAFTSAFAAWPQASDGTNAKGSLRPWRLFHARSVWPWAGYGALTSQSRLRRPVGRVEEPAPGVGLPLERVAHHGVRKLAQPFVAIGVAQFGERLAEREERDARRLGPVHPGDAEQVVLVREHLVQTWRHTPAMRFSRCALALVPGSTRYRTARTAVPGWFTAMAPCQPLQGPDGLAPRPAPPSGPCGCGFSYTIPNRNA